MRSYSLPGIFPFFFFLLFFQASLAQLVSGPMLGPVELRTANIWIEVKPGDRADCWFWKKGEPAVAKKISEKTSPEAWYAPVLFNLVDLEMNTSYEYAITVNDRSGKKPSRTDGSFVTRELWQWRKPAPDFSFLTGSCSYFNDPAFDRPGTPYGKDSSIFNAMAAEKAAFMIWLGDNWYLREADYLSRWGLWYRAHRDRGLAVLQPFLKAMPHYAIWDDHDFGPNDSDKSFELKEESRKVFMNFWANPSYGLDGKGIYTKISYGDCDFFLMDDRYFRSSNNMEAMAYGIPNPGKKMWGDTQIDWLKNALLSSRAPFKFIVTGNQTLNPVSPFECLQEFPVEFHDLMGFLSAEKIGGVLFLTGDRHHSEIIRYERMNDYPLYDITSSPLTSSVGKVFGKEKDNPYRVPGTLVEAQNYSRISVSGKTGERVLLVEFLGLHGEKLAEWKVSEKEIRRP